MSRVCLLANTLYYPEGGGHFWVYLNWALGLRALGCEVIWAEGVEPRTGARKLERLVSALRARLDRYGFRQLALCPFGPRAIPERTANACLDTEAMLESDLLLNFHYDAPASLIERFRRPALVDIDPGSLQSWMHMRWIQVAAHSIYFTIGETVGRPEARFPDAGLRWHHASHCIALDWWPACPPPLVAPFTTVSNWYTANEWMEDEEGMYPNDKRDGFAPFLDLPRHTRQPLELALCLGAGDDDEAGALKERGWRLRDAEEVARSPEEYQRYIQSSRGEFSCVKPSYIRLSSAWISDRTLCYMASGRPAVVQHTGPSRFLPDRAGLFRFRTLEEAATCLELAAGDYERHSRLARSLVEEHFDATKVLSRVLERALVA